MYLKSLKLAGFKSFADRTRLEYRPGVTVVVGPNGSGKSNLVDALSWVLGTQSTKSLRTPKMEDVIFAGTATRPSLGKAEVTLVIDNEDRALDLDLDEVAITRRLYRDGSSDYELNGVGCRLLDIQDLLSDAGVGRHQHVIIGQGEIGRVLNASPEEHRAVIEEAAGILKHKRRKEKSERRLERTDDDLDRLADLLGELNRQMRPLKRQAKAAERYDGLKSEVVALRLYLAGQALEAHDRELTILTSEKSMITEAAQVDSGLVERLGADLAELTETASSVSADLERATSAAAVLETTSERLKRVASVSHERRRALSGRLDATMERKADLEEEAASIRLEIDSVAKDIASAEATASSAETRFRKAEDEERLASTEMALSPEGAVAAVNGEISSLEAAISRDGREEANLLSRIDGLVRHIDEESKEIDQINGDVKKLDTQLGQEQKAYETANKRSTKDQGLWTAAEDAFGAAKLSHASATARVDAVKAALGGRHDSEARSMAESAIGVMGTLISLLDIPTGLESAVETALGQWADAVAFDGAKSVKGVVESIKSSGGGAVQIVTATGSDTSEATNAAVRSGLDTLVSQLGPKADRDLADALLGDVVLAEGWASAWDVVRKQPDLRVVTPEGDLISRLGVVMASPDGTGPAMLEAAEVELEQSETELARADSTHTAAKRDFERSRETERLALEAVEATEARLAGVAEVMARLQATVDTRQAERDRLQERLAQLSSTTHDNQNRVESLRDRLTTLEGEEADRMAAWEEAEATRVQLAADRELARSEWQEAATRHRAITERDRILSDRLARIQEEIERLDSRGTVAGDPEMLGKVEAYAKQAVRSIDARLVELRDTQATLRTENSEVLNALTSAREEHDRARSALAEGKERTSQIDVRLTELRLTREALAESVRRDANAEISDAMGAPRPDVEEDADLEELVESKASQLHRLGPINPLAAAEYAELEERHSFLTDQIADVETSRSELRKVIRALETEIEERFAEAFSEVSSAYQRYFDVLFPGGKGRIRLMDPDDPQSGVAIDAQPLGKKVSQMTLLSGGERSLAALAFLFAIFEARPSPFYVLDEVEAALDDANLRRFLRIVDEFRARAQLIIVTHQQQTMEAADVLYGVTMEPGGSSQALRKEMTPVATPQVA